MCFRIALKMHVRDLHNTGEGWMFKCRRVSGLVRKGPWHLFGQPPQQKKQTKFESRIREDLTFFFKYKIGQMHFSEKMTA